MKKHALLSPSKSSMWLNCTPSARLSEKLKTGGEAADEGSLAHELTEYLIKVALYGKKSGIDFTLTRIKKNKHYTASMMEYCETFASYVIEQFNAIDDEYGNAMIFLEENLDLSKYIPEGFGTGDVIIVAGNVLLIIDFKYGKGVFVSVENNTQMMIYALGAIELVSIIQDIKTVRMTIYQPRLDNISTFSMSAKVLLQWAKSTLIGKAKIAFAGKGELLAGSHCTFCPVKATCSAHAEYNLTIAGEEFDELEKIPGMLPDKKLIELYLRAKQIRSWLASIEEHMLQKALSGKSWNGLKLVHGRSVRVLTNPEAILKILQRKKLSTKLYLSEPQLLGITALENNIGANEFNKIAGKYVAKPKGKPSLVHADNKGQDYSTLDSAIEDFS